jgi:hypothetical protein
MLASPQSVLPHAGHDNPQDACAIRFGYGPKKDIDCGSAGVLGRFLIGPDAHGSILLLHDHVIVTRGDERMAGLDRLTRRSFLNLNIRLRL